MEFLKLEFRLVGLNKVDLVEKVCFFGLAAPLMKMAAEGFFFGC